MIWSHCAPLRTRWISTQSEKGQSPVVVPWLVADGGRRHCVPQSAAAAAAPCATAAGSSAAARVSVGMWPCMALDRPRKEGRPMRKATAARCLLQPTWLLPIAARAPERWIQLLRAVGASMRRHTVTRMRRTAVCFRLPKQSKGSVPCCTVLLPAQRREHWHKRKQAQAQWAAGCTLRLLLGRSASLLLQAKTWMALKQLHSIYQG